MSASHLAEYLEDSASKHPQRVAVVDSEGASLTYEALNQQAEALAAHLVQSGVRPGARVAIALPKSVSAVVALFGTLKARAAYVPLDAHAPIERCHRIFADCQPAALVADSRTAMLAREPHEHVAVVLVGDDRSRQGAPATQVSFERVVGRRVAREHNRSDRRSTDLAYILYTSGSTGVPKGVMISHANVLAFIDWCSATFAPTIEDRFGNHAPFHFDASVLDLFLSVKHGATLYLIGDALGRAPQALAEFVETRRLTIWLSTPCILTRLVQHGHLEAHDGTSLRLVLFGGEVFPVKYLRELQRWWPAATYYNMYGPTEITVACTFARVPSPVPPDRHRPYPIGVPCSHCRTLVLDDARQEISPPGEGLLHVSGPSVSSGYWNRPADNTSAFVIRDGVRWYNTGDVVRWCADGGYEYVGRKDRMVKRRGYRIELDEIETAIRAHASVAETAVVGIPHAEGHEIVAFVATERARTASVVELKTFIATKIPAYMSPDRFVFRDRLPRTASDKVDYQALASLCRLPAAAA